MQDLFFHFNRYSENAQSSSQEEEHKNHLMSKETKGAGSLKSSMNCLPSRRHSMMQSNVHHARWQSHEQRAATKWCAKTVDNTSAIIVARQLMDTTIFQGRPRSVPREEILNWERRMNPRQLVGQIQAELFAANGHPCSNCGQVNAKGFKKVDPDKWEFANEGFLRGRKHLLKKINRRKPSHVHSQVQNVSIASCVEVGKFGVEEEIERLKRDKNVLMQELIRLRQQQQESDNQLQMLGNRLQGMENRQKLMMSFLVKAMQSPGLFSQLMQQNESNHDVAGLNKKRRFLRQDQSASPDGQIIKYQPLMNVTLEHDSSPRLDNNSDSLLVDNFSMLPAVTWNKVVPPCMPESSGFPAACSSSFASDQAQSSTDVGNIGMNDEMQDINILSETPVAIPSALPGSDIPVENFVVSEGENMFLNQISAKLDDDRMPIVTDEDPKLSDIMDSLLEEFIAASPECGETEVTSSFLEAVEMQQPNSGGGCENAGNMDNLMAQMGLLTSETKGRGKSCEMSYPAPLSLKKIFYGWEEFAMDYGLEIGDACVCKLMDTEKLEFRAQVLKGKIPH